MRARRRAVRLATIACLGIVGARSWGEPAPPTQPAISTSAGAAAGSHTVAASTQPASAPLPGPRYLALRYDEDYSYLDGPPGSYTTDFFDPLKNIHLSENWRLRFGGEIRERLESETNRTFGARDPTQDTFLLQRVLVHSNVEYRKLLRFYLEGIDAALFG